MLEMHRSQGLVELVQRQQQSHAVRTATEAEQQGAILDALWPLLAPGGRLLYVTCSVLRAENERQIGAFLARHDDAREKRIPAFWGTTCTHGRQVLPGEEGMDGFFFASIEKHLAA